MGRKDEMMPGITSWGRGSVVVLLVTSGACADDVSGVPASGEPTTGTSSGGGSTSVGPEATGDASTTAGDSTRGPTGTTTGESTTGESTTGASTTGASTTGESTSGDSSGSTGPGGGGGGDCCAAHGATGCDDAMCEAVICAADPYCCDTQWDGVCADAALGNPACLDVGGACPCPDEDIGGTTGPAVASGNTSGDDDDLDASCGGGGGNDRVILFTAPADGSYTFDTFGSGYDTKLSLHVDCATEVSCNDDAGGGLQSQLQLDMTAGQRIMVVVDGYNGAAGDWVLNVAAAPIMPPACGDGVVDAPEVCDGGNLNGQTCLFQGYPGGGVLACTVDCLAFDPAGCLGGPFACSDEDIGSATGPAVAAGDTTGDDDDLNGSCGGAGGNDHVMTFTAPAAATYTFDTFGSGYDTKLGLYADCMSELFCNDDAGGGLQSQLVINMGAGQAVLVVVDGYNGSTGAWVVNITQS